MDEREILIADKDTEIRNEVANYFREAGYQVETTDSAVHVLCSILEKQTPVVLLAEDFDPAGHEELPDELSRAHPP